jgi:inner membrane transporter RhtA
VSRTLVAFLAVVVAMASVQTGASFAKRLFPALGAAGTSTLRLVFASAVLVAIWRPWRPLPSRAALGTIALYGGALGAMNLSFYLSLRTLPLGLAVAIEFLGPLGVAVFASRRALDLAWAALAAVGIALVLPFVPSAAAIDPIGAAWAAMAAACWALYIVFGRRAAAVVEGGVATSLGMLVATAVVLPFGVADAGARLLDPSLLPAAFAVAMLSSAIPYSLEMIGLKRLPAHTFGILMSVEPAMAAVSGWIILGEQLTPRQLIAVGCVMAASLGSARSGVRREPRASSPASP